MTEAIEGFVRTIHKGSNVYYYALKTKDGVARYPKTNSSPGVWCGKKTAATFIAHPWNPVRSYDDIAAKLETLVEINRLVRPEGWSGKFHCIICGGEVYEQVKHFYYHTDPDRIMRNTLRALFINTEA